MASYFGEEEEDKDDDNYINYNKKKAVFMSFGL
jgi:hypothetical protein